MKKELVHYRHCEKHTYFVLAILYYSSLVARGLSNVMDVFHWVIDSVYCGGCSSNYLVPNSRSVVC